MANVTKLDVGDGSLTAGREVEGGQEMVECPLPALVTCQKGLNEPRYAALKGIMAAKRKPVDKIEVASLGIDEATDSVLHRPQPRAAAAQVGRHHHPG